MNGLFHGFGELFINNGYYIGQWANGKPDGIGDAKDFDGNIYSGNFANGLPSGRSKVDGEFISILCNIKF